MKSVMLNFENYIRDNPLKAKSFHPYFEQALNEMIIAGGKRFRPELMLVIVKSLRPDLVEKSFPIGLAIELIHTYSLIHDDLPSLDNASLRRGHPTIHTKYDEVTAILVGDALNTHAFTMIANCDMPDTIKVELIKELTKNAGILGLVLGQAIDCYFENQNLTIEQVIFMHKNKTGKCIAGALKMGCIICQCSKELQLKVYRLGLKVGLLFQIQDDIFDVTKTEAETLKTSNIDTQKNKNTFIKLLGLNETIKYAEELVSDIEKDIQNLDERIRANIEVLFERYIYRHRF